MPSLPTILCTFVGDVARDSRLLRLARTLTAKYDVRILSLAERSEAFALDRITVSQLGRSDLTSLRRSIVDFWRAGIEPAVETGAVLVLAADLYSLPVSSAAAKRLGAPLIYDSREWYSSIAALASRPVTQWYWRLTEGRHVARSSLILTVNESIARLLRQRFPHRRVECIRNYPSWRGVEKTDTLRRVLHIPDGRIMLLSQGGLQEGRGALPLIESLRHLEGHHLVFLGSGPLKNEIHRRAEAARIQDRVSVIDGVRADDLPLYTASADIGCCVIEDLGKSYRLSLPNKLFEYIAAGVPVVASDLPEISAVIRGGPFGVTVRPGDAQAIARGITALDPKGELHRSCVDNCLAGRNRFTWEGEGARFLALVDELASQPAGGSR